MIYTKLCNLERYLGQSETLDTAIRHLASIDLKDLNMGRNDVDGDRVFINRFDFQTMDEAAAVWEGHEFYGDIHLLLSGHEKIGVADTSTLTATNRKPEEDFIGYEGAVQVWCPMSAGDALIVFPEDAHMVKVTDGAPSDVQKAVVKFKV